MRIIDRILLRISEMAYNKSKAEDLLAGDSRPINQHIMKLILWGWNTDWAKTIFDIASNAGDIRLKPDNKKPNRTFIEINLFKSHYSTTSDFIKAIKTFAINNEKEYGKFKNLPDSKVKELYEAIKTFIIDEISKDDIYRNDFYSKLKDKL